MEKKFENQTLYNDDTLWAACEFMCRKRFRVVYASIILMGAIILSCSILALLNPQRQQSTFYLILLMLAGASGIVSPLWSVPIVVYIAKRNNTLTLNVMNTYSFYPEHFEENTPQSHTIIYYHQLHRVWESKEFFYLCTGPDTICILYKLGFTQGNAQQFSQFIQQMTPGRYRRRA